MAKKQVAKQDDKELFNKLKEDLLSFDPVHWAENHLMLDGKPFSLSGNGYKPFQDMYRYLGIKALEKDTKPLILVSGRQIGKTTMASVLEMYFMGSGLFGTGNKPPIRVIHAFPLLELAYAYSKTKLNTMISESQILGAKDEPITGAKRKSYMQSLLDKTSDSNNSLNFKQFVGGNHLWIESTGVDADRLMGRSADVLLFDEIQRIPTQAIGSALKILTAAKYGRPGKGVQFYFGTPRKKGSDFYKMWMKSSQQYFYLGCEKCKEYFPLYTPESDDWQKIWIHTFTVKCTKCNAEQDKLAAQERGKWIATKSIDDPDCDMVGFHINQLYMPMFSREAIDKERPGKHPTNTERIFMNEVMGEFYQGDSSPITAEEIKLLCGDKDRKYATQILPQELGGMNDQLVVLGIDYGAKSDLEQLADQENSKQRGQSYSTAVVLLAKGPGLLSVEFSTRFKRNDPESKKGIIEELMRKYSIQLAVGDIGFSNDFSITLYNIYGDRYLVSRAHPKVNDKIKFNTDTFPKEIGFERDYYIGELYDQMKKGMIRFPLGDYEQMAWLAEHCASMEIKPSISKYGDPTIHYVKGNTPNDGFMALLNAYIAYKFLITKGFTNNNPNTINNKFSNKPLILGSFIDKRF